MTRAQMVKALSGIIVSRGIEAAPGAKLRQLFDYLRHPPQNGRQVGAVRIVEAKRKYARWRDRLSVELIARLGARRWSKLLAEKASASHYVHASHYGLQWAERFNWITRHGVQSTFFVHDLIPIDFPEYCSAGAHRSHKLKLQTIATLAQRVAVNSNYTAERFTAFLQAHGLPVPSVEVHRLGTGRLSSHGEADLPHPAFHLQKVHPFFLCAGTIEARKNVKILLDVWRLLAKALPAQNMPRLVLAGSRGWSNDELLRDLDGMTDIAPYVVEVNGLNDSELILLMEQAEAVLKPSIAEGSSLVPAEAIARGLSVIASDIPAHRELPELNRQLVGVEDIEGWLDAVSNLSRRRKFSASWNWSDFASSLLSIPMPAIV